MTPSSGIILIIPYSKTPDDPLIREAPAILVARKVSIKAAVPKLLLAIAYSLISLIPFPALKAIISVIARKAYTMR
jgi:hypothetical protein